jgi:carbonic anhydrase
MAETLVPVRSPSDILPGWQDTPLGDLLRYASLGLPPARQYDHPVLLLTRCWEDQAPLPLPPGFALALAGPGGVLKRSPFDVSWAVAAAGVRAIAVVGHADCGLAGLRSRREEFVTALVSSAGWERPAAEQHFDHWADLCEVADPAAAAAAEARRLKARYPGLSVGALLREGTGGGLLQIVP